MEDLRQAEKLEHTSFSAVKKADTGGAYTAEKRQQKGLKNFCKTRNYKGANSYLNTGWYTTARKPPRHTARPGEHPTRRQPTWSQWLSWAHLPPNEEDTRQMLWHTREENQLSPTYLFNKTKDLNYHYEHSTNYDTWLMDKCTSCGGGPHAMVHPVLGHTRLPARRRQKQLRPPCTKETQAKEKKGHPQTRQRRTNPNYQFHPLYLNHTCSTSTSTPTSTWWNNTKRTTRTTCARATPGI